ncbi:MAG: bifunctional [glutamine synthetase] adenylyltransferase/[glutamine synthetase]-adenylyl-L-tyrosine phosphorylase [Egibacteraceae bacterium]
MADTEHREPTSTETSTPAAPAARGTPAELGRRLGGEAAAPALRILGVWGDDGPRPEATQLAAAIAASPTADHAVTALARAAELQPDAWARLASSDRLITRLATVAGASDALGDLLARSPDALEVVTGDLAPFDVAQVRAIAAQELAAATDEPARALTTAQRRGLLRVAARDLLGLADTPAVGRELAALAEGLLAAAADHVAEDGVRVAVIGMGKLGGRELNYVSDVDVMFVADGDAAHATRVAERFLRLLGEVTPDGRCYELDVSLRPEGRDGPLVRTVEAYRTYYDRWAKTWEFQALLKARPVAGDAEVGLAFAELAGAYVWPDRLPADSVAEIQRMKGHVERSAAVRKAGPRQLKLAPGGLRDIEFAVQLLQLVHGRHDPALRSSNTLEALSALAEGGYVDDGDAQLFDDAYQFLRTVEHRLQLLRLRRTHTVPRRNDERYRVARAVGFRDLRASTALEQFDREYQRVQGYVRRLHEKLFYRPLLERFAELGRAESLGGVDGGMDAGAARERLAALGFHHPVGAMAHLDALARGVSRRARLLRTLLPAILPTLAASPDPDGGLAAFRSLADRLGESPGFLRTLRDNPPVGELLARVLGASKVAGQWLERQPDVVATLADLGALEQPVAAEHYRRLAGGLARRTAAREDASLALRRLRRREAVRVAVRDLGGYASVTEVAAELTGIAEACLEAAVRLVAPDDVRLAVIAMGKLGGRELGYASDLDVLLVYEPGDARDAALRACEELVSLLGDITPEGQAFQVDLGLRPEGRDGPLARTLDSYRSYYERWADTWEFQALTQARPVAGDAELGAAFTELVEPLTYPDALPADRLGAVRRMKARMERERGPHPRQQPTARRLRPTPGRRLRPRPADRPTVREGERIDVKLGAGGLADVEWTVQLLQLREGGHTPEVRRAGTLEALDALAAAGVVRQRDAEWLAEGWRLASRIRNALYLAGARDTATVPVGRGLEHLARMLGYPPPGAQALMEDLGRSTRRVRKAHQRMFYD